jgi:ubiquinol-cytochrome c reductase iron-sulfur subunit
VLRSIGHRDADVDRLPERTLTPEQTVSYRQQQGGRSELVVAGLLLAGAGSMAGFVVLLIIDPQTQLLALLLGAALAAVAVAMLIAGSDVVPQETAIEARPQLADPEDQNAVASILSQGTDGISRRRLLGSAAGTAGVMLGATIAAVPLTQAGPGTDSLHGAPWQDGVSLVAEDGTPITADDLDVGGFLTAFPDGSDVRELGAPIVVVKVDPAQIAAPAGRESWSPEGLLAFSKICTHAGCAVSLFRSPLAPAHSPGPALACPCHYSTFDVLRGAEVIFGPAGRPLPQLPLRIEDSRALVAAGKLSGSVGPAWWGTHRS